VGESVIADDMSGFDDFAGEVGTLLDVASNQEKCGMHAVLSEDLQQPQRVRIVGAVVVGEGELLRTSGNTGEGAAVPLSGGRHGLVGNRDRGSGRSGEHGSEHGGILKDCRLKI
jgi:hypothetical protein